MVCDAPECESLEFTLREHDWQGRLAQERVAYSRRHVQHVGATRRAEVLLPHLKIAGKIVFEIRMVTTQTILTDLVGLRVEIRNEDASVVPALPADDLSAG